MSLFNEKNFSEVKMSAMGQGINKLATIAEIIKHRVKGLHQLNDIKTQTFEDTIESKDETEENKEIKVTRKVTCLIVKLTLDAPSE